MIDMVETLSADLHPTLSRVVFWVNDIIEKLNVLRENKTAEELRQRVLKNFKKRLGWVLNENNLAVRSALMDPTQVTKIRFLKKEILDQAWEKLSEEAICLQKKLVPAGFPVGEKAIKAELEDLREYFEKMKPEDVPSDALEWWKHYSQGIRLQELAKKYLSIPETSTPSERAFSSAGVIYNERRASLDCGTVEKLIFIRENSFLLPKDLKPLLVKFLKDNNIELSETTIEEQKDIGDE